MNCGTLGAYAKGGCRCAECREAKRAYEEGRRRRRGVLTREEFLATLSRTHGCEGTYQWGCRCPECREAHRVYDARRRGMRMAKRPA